MTLAAGVVASGTSFQLGEPAVAITAGVLAGRKDHTLISFAERTLVLIAETRYSLGNPASRLVDQLIL
jgi:hypothetical protein